ncbi:TRAP dicarboxylate transporter- DctP subunit [Xylanimonas cellulosilytica DSM 15894]|uniref:TRAP dicarboxylate transporter-DctP subunit n=1 Tax=Xylanimonas cellulosilytica (strain DSM 15894 / JCM 12276 / CECT 5975 / KCTC 9989 / LMG 20990 / NBRC 107835 / XIL07) TaxID=446471 RepID=D1BS01_XYLCX|nr:TRAP dicarboxylate transporter- DctP subunit [Xylanimonas cellulosilytica]ACZ30493.1 TRAP dicarboxylate transporter- DctP subunit [Xylanimonas cellulosilytica DSM 15894]
MKASTLAAAAVAVVLVAAGCTPAAQSAEPVTLRVGTDDRPGRPSADQIEEFARHVSDLSEGRITIEPVWQAVGDEDHRPDWDQQVARLVMSGELEMGLIPSRSWDTEGVETLRPLTTPFLVDSDELLAEILTSDLADEMMAGLDEVGVVGLSIFPEGLRHPFGYEKALAGPEDYAGGTLRVPTSATSREMFAVFGASTNDVPPDPEEHIGIESGFLFLPGGIATSNVTFYPKANVLVTNEAVFDGLAAGDREILERAAAQTLEWTVANLPRESALAQEFCEGGGVVRHATDQQLAELTRAAEPVIEGVRAADRRNGLVLDAITQLKADVPTAVPAPECGEDDATGPTGQESVLNGVYRFDVSRNDLIAAGTNRNFTNVGVWTYTLHDGEFELQLAEEESGDLWEESGTYRVDGDRVTFYGPALIPPGDTLTWEKDASGGLVFENVNVSPMEWHVFSQTWEWVADIGTE